MHSENSLAMPHWPPINEEENLNFNFACHVLLDIGCALITQKEISILDTTLKIDIASGSDKKLSFLVKDCLRTLVHPQRRILNLMLKTVFTEA